jgi:FAD:protein FMN transferase
MRSHASFEAMGCEVVVAGASPTELERIRRLFEQREGAFSRFLPDSELERVNTGAGKATLVSPSFARAVEAALWAARVTNGIVDPTLGAAIEAAGYDRDFGVLAADPGPPGPPVPARPGAVALFGRVLLLRSGVKLDLNGVVKAIAVDDALALLRGPGFVSAGGDLAARGGVDVALPRGGAIRLLSGGLATSGRSRRRWLRGGEEQHHLLDPATGRPAGGPWEEVTVCGKSCLAADVAAKAAYLLGDAGPGWLDARGLPGRFVAPDSVHENRSWRASLERMERTCT